MMGNLAENRTIVKQESEIVLTAEQKDLVTKINLAKTKARDFVCSCITEEALCRLTPKSETSPYALCFTIFLLNFLGDKEIITGQRELWDRKIRQTLKELKDSREQAGVPLKSDKVFLQLLTFSLSSLHLLGTLKQDPLAEIIEPLLPQNVSAELKEKGCLEGKAQSGNQAMFMAILLLHAKEHLGLQTDAKIQEWVSCHLDAMNEFGFWGKQKALTHLQFQNGYHQYEIFNYLNVDVPRLSKMSSNLIALADSYGHFAPYPGGGGCYDFDAIFLLTYPRLKQEDVSEQLLQKIAKQILLEQKENGGFAENVHLNALSPYFYLKVIRQLASSNSILLLEERLKRTLSVLRPKNRRVHTHWTQYSRQWGEADLWDTWFRLQAIALIQKRLWPELKMQWGFIEYPGIGFH
ncbi:MAG: hypothetical protein H7A33_01695 [Deltaproteobacteria bacterium]|nr:hypothetical protein [Deltaproteobacteria bacterium]